MSDVCSYCDGEGFTIDLFDCSEIPCPQCNGTGVYNEEDDEPI